MQRFIFKNYLFIIFWAILTAVSFWVSRISPAPPQTHFVDQAYAFLNGQLDLVPPIRLFDDYALSQNKAYIYLNPLPAIILTPFVFFTGLSFSQEILMPFFTILNFFLLYKICRHFGSKNETDCLWLATFFIFGSIYLFLSLTTISAYYAQIVGVTFLLLAIFEFLTKKRWFLIGLLVSFAGATRETLFLSCIFFFLEIIREKINFKLKVNKIFLLLIPIFIIFILLLIYNYARFQNPLETGYNFQTNTNPIYLEAKKEGVFSLKHVPGNLYLLLLKSPDPIRRDNLTYILKPPYLRVNEWGLGIFFTSPLFLYLILAKLKDRHVFPSLITTLFMSVPVLTYYGVGLWQYGYRYALDFYPFLFLILLSIFKDGLPLKAKILIVYGIIFNLFFMFSIWYKYPFSF